MKKSFLSFGVSVALCGSLYGYDYNIVDGNQMLGAVIDIKDMTEFDNKCVNFVYHIDYTNGENYLVHNANQTLSGYDDLTQLNQGQGFIVNATGSCKVTIQDPIVFKGYTYSTIKSPTTGKTWLDRNLGATKVCDKKRSEFASNLDYENSQKDCFGDYYQWGRKADGHQLKTSLTDTSLLGSLTNTNTYFILNNSASTYYDWVSSSPTDIDIKGTKRSDIWGKTTDGTSVCPAGFRVPTIGELEKEGADINTLVNVLKFPLSGVRAYYTNSIYGKGGYGSVWSDTPSYNYYANAYNIREDSSNTLTGVERASGRSIRCIKN